MWKSVKNELPRENGRVLVYIKSKEMGKPFIGIAWYDKESTEWGLVMQGWADSITHWMPLPEPPVEGK